MSTGPAQEHHAHRAARALMAIVALGLALATGGCPDGGLGGDKDGFPPRAGTAPGAPCRPATDPDGECDQDLNGADFVDMFCLAGTCVVDCNAGGDYLCRDVVADFLTCSDLAGGACVRACGAPDGTTCPDGFSCFLDEGSCLPTGSFPSSPCRADADDPCDQDLGGLSEADMICVQGQCAVGCSQGGSALCRAVDASLTCSDAAGGACVRACNPGCAAGTSCLGTEGACLPTGAFPGSPCLVAAIGAEPTCAAVTNHDDPSAPIAMECVGDTCVVPCSDDAAGEATCAAVNPSLGCSGAAGACVPRCVEGGCPGGFSCFASEDRCLPTGAFPGSPCLPDGGCLTIGGLQMTCDQGTCAIPCDAGPGGDALCGAVDASLACSALAGACVPRCAAGACPAGFSCFSREDRCLPTGAFPSSPCRPPTEADAPRCDVDLRGNTNLDMVCTAAEVCALDCALGGDFICSLADPALHCSGAAGDVCVERCGDGGACGAGFGCLESEGSCLPLGAFPGSPCDPDGAGPTCGELGGAPMVCAPPSAGLDPVCLVPCATGGTALCQAIDAALSCFTPPSGAAVCLPNGAFPESLCRPDPLDACDQDLRGQRDLDLACFAGTCQVDCTQGGGALCDLFAAGSGLPPGTFSCVDTGDAGAFCARAGCASASAPCPADYRCDAALDACLPYLPVHVVHTNDLHSRFDPVGPSSSARLGGFPALATLIREAQARADARGAVRLTVDGGDWTMGSLYQALQGTVETDFLRYARYDAAALGEHDLDWGVAGLVAFLSKDIGAAPILSAVLSQQLGCTPGGGGCPALAPVPVVTSGLLFDDVSPADDALHALYDPDDTTATTTAPLNRFIIVERRGVRVGIFGLLGRAAVERLATPGPPTFEDPAETAREMVALLREPPHDVDLIVALSHSGSLPAPYRDEDEALALEVDGIDLIVSGHTEVVVPPKRVGGTWIVQAGRYGEHLGELELAIPTVPWAPAHGKLDPEIARWTLHDVSASTPKDAILLAARTAYLSQINSAFAGAGLTYDTVLGTISGTIAGASGVESPIGDLVADAVRAAVGARLGGTGDARAVDVAIVPNAVLRSELRTTPGAGAAPVTFGDAFAVVPLGASPTDATSLGYPVVTIYVTGEELRQVLEVATTLTALRGDDFWLSVSGIKWAWDPARPAFHRVSGIWLDPGGTATVCASSTNLLGPTGAVKDPTHAYRVAADLYTAGFLAQLSEVSGGLLAVAPKSATGAAVSVTDRIVPEAGGGQLRAWRAFVEHLVGLATANGGVISPPTGGRVLTAAERTAACGQ